MRESNHAITKDGELRTDKIGETIDRIDDDKKDRILEDFESFKKYLHNRIKIGESIGLGEEQLAKVAQKVAGYLAENEKPRNSEEKLLQELWKVGDEEQRHKLAHMLVKLAQSS
ncbi:DUF3243 domain-containing protein [Saccharibacillus sp. CPCC 101409]|uniref:DUF3243 domain-containing protein n=1 Tax=Saccharibacillus sp. CPCC 101409 TaxID=3058041 RepID=UPI0026724368|nr:DUF3243 domain-containing protein [Saccharibacillus sp. CPCC 101409]MDO3411708.1 DUF3243 domain-containing protein [Saccharibacillus sp. CPCC 101409]